MNFQHYFKESNSKIWIFAIIASTFVLYYNTLSGSLLNWDDTTYLINNRLMNQNISFNSFYNIYQVEHHISLVLSSFLVQIRWFGVDPFGMHLFNLFFHIFNVLLVYVLSKKLLKNNFFALFIALLFAIHPMRSETVGWIIQRKDILYSFFFLLSSIIFLNFLKTKKILPLIFVLFFGTLASLSKVQALALPFVLIILEYFVDKKITTKSLIFLFPLIFLQTNIFFSPIEMLIFLVLPSIVCVYSENLQKIRFSNFSIWDKLKLNSLKKHFNLLNLILIIFALIFVSQLLKSSFYPTNELIKSAFTLGIFYLFVFHEKIKFKYKNAILFTLIFISLIGAYYIFTYILSVSLTERIVHPIPTRIQFALYSLSYYLVKLFAPFNLSAMHPYPDKPNVPISLLYQISPFVIILITSLIAYYLYKLKNQILKQQIIFGLLFFIINISFVLHLIPIQGRVIVADRYTYLAYFGLFFSLIPMVGNFYSKFKEKPLFNSIFSIIIGFILMIFAYQTWTRNKVWKNDEIFWTDVIQKDKSNHYANFSLALFYFEKKQYEKALEFYNKAIQKFGNNYEYYTNRGSCYVKLKETKKAIDDFAKAIDLNPKNAYAFNNRGVLFRQIGDLKNALIDFQIASQLDSNYTEAKINFDKTNALLSTIEAPSDNKTSNQEKAKLLNDLGVKKAMDKQFDAAILDFSNAILLDSLNMDAYKNRGNAFASIQKFNEAMKDYNKVLTFNPNDAGIFMNIGNIKHQLNDKSACDYWKKAKSLGINDADIMINRFCK